MQKWIPVALAAGTAAIAFPAQPAAGPRTTDGCALLAEVVYERVRTGSFGAAAAGRQVDAAAYRGVSRCERTAEAVSAGFTRALAESQVFVTWPTPSEIPGDRCLSADLSQCYPRSNPYLSPYGSATTQWVASRWRAVQATVGRSMPAGVASDESRFSSAALDTQLGRRLGARTRCQRY